MKAAGACESDLVESATKMEVNSELLSHRKKVEQMTVLLKYYRNELESQKVRRDGVETVSRLLAECRQENLVLKKKQTSLETTVKNLQNRLMVNGLSSNSGDDETEVIVPGISKQTLTNLALENKRLRSMLQKGNSSDSESIDSLQKPSEDAETQQLIEKLEAENKSMKLKLSDLETLFKSSNNEKDNQLIQYQEELQQLRQKRGESIGARKTISVLKEQLRVFMSHCQDLESQLGDVQEIPEERENTAIELTPVTKQAVEKTDSVDGVDVKRLLEEKQKLQDKIEDVTNMNQRWQDFYNERERYTQSLEKELQELRVRLKEAMRSGPSQEINRRIEQVLEKSQKDIAQVEEMRRKAEDEVEKLRREAAMKDAHISQLENQVTILSHTPHLNSFDASSTIEHLKAQIQVCTEDFEKERQDRQVALQKIGSLQEHNAQLQKLNTHLQTLVQSQLGQATNRTASREHVLYGHHDAGTLQPRCARFGQNMLAYDGSRSPQDTGSWRDFPDFEYEGSGKATSEEPVSMPGTATELIARGPKTKHSSSPSLASEGTKQENFLTCPKCNKEFSEERQGELLAHMDVCWE